MRKKCGLSYPLVLLNLSILRSVSGQEGSGTTISPFEDCNGYPTLANSNAFSGETTHGSVLTGICNSRYINTGAEQYICNNGEWEPNGEGSEPYCAIQCVLPSIENGQANLTDNGCRFEGCTAAFMCATGYTLNGQESLTCQASGNWAELPTCQLVDCGVPVLDSGTYNGLTTYGSEVTFKCDNNSYLLAGQSSALCGADGSWSELPTCIYSCGEFENVSNANLTFSCTGQQLQGCSVFVRCSTGFNLTGNSTVQCFAGQGWGFRPFCVFASNGTTFNIILIMPAPTSEARAAFERGVQIELERYYARTMGNDNFYAVIMTSFSITNITGISQVETAMEEENVKLYNAPIDFIFSENELVEVDYNVAVADTETAKGQFAKAQADLVTTESLDVLRQQIVPLETRLLGVALMRDNRSTTELREASCQLYELSYRECPSGTQCQITLGDDTTTYCEAIGEDDAFDLKLGLGVGIPLFLLACTLVGVVIYYIYGSKARKTRRWRRALREQDSSDSATMSGFFPAAIPTRFNTADRRGPLFGSNLSEKWSDTSSRDYDERPQHVRRSDEKRLSHFISDHSRFASNFSWDFMYPHLGEDFTMPRPKI